MDLICNITIPIVYVWHLSVHLFLNSSRLKQKAVQVGGRLLLVYSAFGYGSLLFVFRHSVLFRYIVSVARCSLCVLRYSSFGIRCSLFIIRVFVTRYSVSGSRYFVIRYQGVPYSVSRIQFSVFDFFLSFLFFRCLYLHLVAIIRT